jgi:lipoprotein-anchoring transpeptidase ErfK/SrfK
MRRLFLVPAAWFAILGSACAAGAPEPTLTPTFTITPTPAPATPTPLPTATPRPTVAENQAIVVGGDVRVRAAPNTRSEVLTTLPDKSVVVIDAAVQGENWLIGNQTWVSSIPDWTTTWFRLTDGSYVYAGFVFILQPGETSPFIDPAGQEKWVDVNITTQTATAMLGQTPLYTAPVTTGLPDFPTPLGTQRLKRDGRVAVERMTASQAGYSPDQATYDVERVLFTQYFDNQGNALHLNYWRPKEVFGRTRTSHGCVGMQLHDAQWFWLWGEPGMRVEIHP